MNLALFLTEKNRQDVRCFIEAAVKSQQLPVNGALALVHEKQLDVADELELLGPLGDRFSARVVIPVRNNTSLGADTRIASLVAQFLLGGYARFPHPWLMVDGYAVPKVGDFMQRVDTQHNSLAGHASGRGSAAPGSMTPVGPVVIGCPARDLKVLRFATNESWRSRGRFYFARCGWRTVPAEDYLFSISRTHAEPEAAPEATPEVAPEPPARPVFDPSVLDGGQVSEADELSTLRAQYEARFGKKPHHMWKADKLATLISEPS